MIDIVKFLRARLDEDEAGALSASRNGGRWISQEEHVETVEGCLIADFELKSDSSHCSEHDPARVLREVAAKRAMIEPFDQAVRKHEWLHDPWHRAIWTLHLRNAIYPLATVYSDHPDYDRKWGA